ncbi:MAG: methyltransferase domain-containing protein [Ferruginibacter sp.]
MINTKVKEMMGPLFPVLNKLRLAGLRLKYAGNKVHCVCCGSNFSRFAPFGNEHRQNAWCTKCQSLERDRLLWMYFDKKTNLYTDNLKLLHIAPEIVFFNKFKTQKNLDYQPVDIFPHLYPKGTTYLNILDHQLPDNSYDVIICNHVFQYIEDDKTAMRNILKLLKPGGWAILQVPINTKGTTTFEDSSITDPKEREKVFGLDEHVRYYSYDYADRLRAIGFHVTVDDYTTSFTDEEIFRYGFFKGDAIYYCTK